MRISHLLIALCLAAGFVLGAGLQTGALAYQGQGEYPAGVQDDRDRTSPSQTSPSTSSQPGQIDETDVDRAGTSWLATVIAFIAGLGLGWLMFRRPADRGREDTNFRRAA